RGGRRSRCRAGNEFSRSGERLCLGDAAADRSYASRGARGYSRMVARATDMKSGNRAGIGMTSARTRERLVQRLRDQGIANAAVLDQIRNVPRRLFVDEALATRAYEDTALPIGHGQTISQPYVVARMTEALLETGSPRKVLEIGT